MAQINTPIVNSWYKLPDSQIFRVISINEHDLNIAIQYSDGALEEVDLGIWDKLGVKAIEPSVVLPPELTETFTELDYYEMGAAPGTEGFDFSLNFSE